MYSADIFECSSAVRSVYKHWATPMRMGYLQGLTFATKFVSVRAWIGDRICTLVSEYDAQIAQRLC